MVEPQLFLALIGIALAVAIPTAQNRGLGVGVLTMIGVPVCIVAGFCALFFGLDMLSRLAAAIRERRR